MDRLYNTWGIRPPARGGSARWSDKQAAGVILRTETFGQTYTLSAESGEFSVSAGSQILNFELATTGEAGSAAPLPSLSTLLESTAASYTLTADAGEFALSGSDAALETGVAPPDVPDVLASGGTMFGLPPVRKRRPKPVDPEWDEESDDAGVLVAVGIM